ncbi:signal peptide protein [Rhodopirellula maiorica SM1]|uniref:Signal peptide protein n=1 Tax=Rhodopirellula maiorica SM1 TaxID=1265738 RepID=M5RD69_9BACT|nr:signal peptide protein [Rhodopirellula maiorica SM1]
MADGNEAAQIVKDLAAKIQNEPKAPKFSFDVSTYKGVTMHLIEADVPQGEDELQKMFGPKLRVHVGTGAKSVFVAVGKDSEALMQKLIDSGASDQGGVRPVGQFRIKLLPILQYAQSIETNEVIAAMIDTLSRASDGGDVMVVQKSIVNGQESRMLISEGVLQAVGSAVRQVQQQKMQNNGSF